MVEPLRHRRTKEAETDMSDLQQPRHISTLPDAADPACPLYVRFSNRPFGVKRFQTFRLSTSTVSMSLTGSCFSSESAPRPFHHGIRRQGGTIFHAALPSN